MKNESGVLKGILINYLGVMMEKENNAIKAVLTLLAIDAILSYPAMLALNYIFGFNMAIGQAFMFLALYTIHVVFLAALFVFLIAVFREVVQEIYEENER